MSKRKGRGPRPAGEWEGERTMAEAEADAAASELEELPDSATGPQQFGVEPHLPPGGDTAQRGDARCICGATDLLLEAYLQVSNGRVDPNPLEVEGLTCPECGREFEAVVLADGRVVRGEFQGWADLDEDEA